MRKKAAVVLAAAAAFDLGTFVVPSQALTPFDMFIKLERGGETMDRPAPRLPPAPTKFTEEECRTKGGVGETLGGAAYCKITVAEVPRAITIGPPPVPTTTAPVAPVRPATPR